MYQNKWYLDTSPEAIITFVTVVFLMGFFLFWQNRTPRKRSTQRSKGKRLWGPFS
jgi:preprotein translocase subunit YajC